MTSSISPQAFVGEGVTIGDGVSIGPGAVILGPCTIEDGAWIGPGAQIGAPPEMSDLRQNAAWSGDLAYAGVRIKSRAVIREGAVIHQGSYRETTVGARSWVLNRAYLAHDVQLGDDVTVSAGVSIGGHCLVDDRVNIGMNASVHQRRVIGAGAMVGMATPLTRDVPPFAKVYGSPPRLMGVNTIGAERAGHEPQLAARLSELYADGDVLTDAATDLASWGTLEPVVAWWQARGQLHPVAIDASFAHAK